MNEARRSGESNVQSSENTLSTLSKGLSSIAISNSPLSYRYHSLDQADSIRILKILPGPLNAPTQIQLRHGSISDMPTTAAVSYEWGISAERHQILCEGYVLRVTSNLLDLLHELRSSGEMRDLWIDAICINQEDLEERAQQVPLMRDIYENAEIVLMWLGKEASFTEESHQILSQLGEIADNIRKTDETFGRLNPDALFRFQDPSKVVGGEIFLRLRGKPAWDGVFELLSGRSYFTRLWIMQENILASKAVLLLRHHRIDLELFAKGINLIWYCKFLFSDVTDATAFRNARGIVEQRVKRSSGEYLPPLGKLLGNFTGSKATDPRDHLFGLLGLFQSTPVVDGISVDYTKSHEEVFEAATRYIILQEEDLYIWLYLVPQMTNETAVRNPSWVPDYSAAARCPSRETIVSSACVTEDRKISIQGPILTAYGFIVEVLGPVNEVWRGSEENVKTLSKNLFLQGQKDKTVSKYLSGLGQAMMAYEPTYHDWKTLEQHFFTMVSRWTLLDLGLSPSAMNSNSLLETLAKDSPFLLERYPEEVGSGMRVQDLLLKYGELQWMHEETNLLPTDYEDYEDTMSHTLGWWEDSCDDFRDIYKTTAGYFGIGPHIKSETALVREGDCIASIDTAPNPVILRRHEDGIYTLIGNTYIGGFADSPLYGDGNAPRSVPIRIR